MCAQAAAVGYIAVDIKACIRFDTVGGRAKGRGTGADSNAATGTKYTDTALPRHILKSTVILFHERAQLGSHPYGI